MKKSDEILVGKPRWNASLKTHTDKMQVEKPDGIQVEKQGVISFLSAASRLRLSASDFTPAFQDWVPQSCAKLLLEFLDQTFRFSFLIKVQK